MNRVVRSLDRERLRVAQTPQMVQFLFESKPFEQYRGWVGALGTSLGTALGVKAARPERTVVAVLGDGALRSLRRQGR